MLCPPGRSYKLLILTEKPSVAKDFATALSCKFYNGAYRNGQTVITNCIGHLFREEKPDHYGTSFPVIPDHWDYCLPEDSKLAQHSKFVITLLKEHKKDKIIIATDADREGEIIARECLEQAGIFDISNILSLLSQLSFGLRIPLNAHLKLCSSKFFIIILYYLL